MEAVIRSIFAFVIAVLVAYSIGAFLATQHVLGALTELGMDITFGVWAEATAHDLVSMFPTYGPLIAVAFAIAIPVAALICRPRNGWHRTGYISACFAAVLVMHLLLPLALDVTPVAAARITGGLLQQGLAGAVGGYVFYLLGRARVLESTIAGSGS